MNLVPYMRSLQKVDVTFTVTYGLERATRDGNQIVAHVGSDCGASPASATATRSSSTMGRSRSTSSISR